MVWNSAGSPGECLEWSGRLTLVQSSSGVMGDGSDGLDWLRIGME